MARPRVLSIGRVLGGFRIDEEIGRGGCAVVYGARHEITGEEVALKLMLDQVEDATLKREFRIARAFSHSHLVRLHEMHHGEDGVYFTMQRVRGGDVVARCRRVVDPVARVALVKRLFAQLADALHYLHAAAVVHRDLKPGNVLVDDHDRVVVVDFGLAQPLAITPRGGFSGTYAYAAPERLRGQPATPSSDWFALGVLMFEAITGELPLGPDPRATIGAWLAGQRVRTGERVPVEAAPLAPLLDGLLEPAPERRAGPSQVFGMLGRPGTWSIAHTLVGHDDAIRWLDDRLAGTTRVIGITGASGTGKTTLVRRALDARRGDYVVLGSRCDPRESVPFNALDGAVTELLELARRTRTVPIDDVSLLERIFERAGELPPGTAPHTISSAIAGVLAAIAPQGRVLLCIDDVQWSDRDSVPILEQLLADRTLDLRCVVVARGGAHDIPARLRPTADQIFVIRPLDGEASIALLRQLAPRLEEARARALSELGGGLPLVLEQAAGWALAEADETLPASFGELMIRLSARRSEAHRELLETLAVHSHSLEIDVLLACDRAVLSPAYDLLDAGLVEFERRAGRYRVQLRHRQITDALLTTISDSRMRAHHLRLAMAFERARPDDANALFDHLNGAGEIERARAPALRSARAFRAGLAFHRAAERYRWLLVHASDRAESASLQHELADVLSRAGDAMDAGETYLGLAASSDDAREKRALRRAAAEQLLRAGNVVRGRALLETCLEELGITVPRAPALQVLSMLGRRLRIRRLDLRAPAHRSQDPEVTGEIELAWSAGLGLNLIDVVASTLAQARFTELALRRGTPEQMARAVAVEYSYTMLVGGPLSGRRGESLRRAMDERSREISSPYARAMTDLSWAAGDFFRGELEGIEDRLTSAQRGFEQSFGAKSWEIANCGMYASWAALERGDLEGVATRVPELLRFSTSRGDALYRQCFASGYAATAWLILDRGDELAARLDEMPRPQGGFQLTQFFELVARHRLDVHRGHARAAWQRIASLWPDIRRSGFLLLRWLRLALGVLGVQAALGARDEPGALAFASSWIAKLSRIDHPAARPWSLALRASLLAPNRARAATLADLARAEVGFERAGHTLAAFGVRHQRGLLGEDVSVPWGSVVRRPDALAAAIGLPPPAIGFR